MLELPQKRWPLLVRSKLRASSLELVLAQGDRQLARATCRAWLRANGSGCRAGFRGIAAVQRVEGGPKLRPLGAGRRCLAGSALSAGVCRAVTSSIAWHRAHVVAKQSMWAWARALG